MAVLIFLVILSGYAFVWLTVQIQSPSYQSFEPWCVHRDFLLPSPKRTVDKLLQQAETTDCKQATQFLSQQTRLALDGDKSSWFISQLSDLRPISSLTQLTELGLVDNEIEDLEPLRSLTQLVVLNFDDNYVRDLSPLAGLTQLKELRATNNHLIGTLQPLAALVNLEHLGLASNGIRDVSPLASLVRLKTLILSGNKIQNFSSLKSLTQLERLSVPFNPIVDRTCPVSPQSVCEFR